MFGLKSDEVMGQLRRIHNEELYSLLHTKYYSGDQIKKNEMGRACRTCGGKERCMQGEV